MNWQSGPERLTMKLWTASILYCQENLLTNKLNHFKSQIQNLKCQSFLWIVWRFWVTVLTFDIWIIKLCANIILNSAIILPANQNKIFGSGFLVLKTNFAMPPPFSRPRIHGLQIILGDSRQAVATGACRRLLFFYSFCSALGWAWCFGCHISESQKYPSPD